VLHQDYHWRPGLDVQVLASFQRLSKIRVELTLLGEADVGPEFLLAGQIYRIVDVI
jgi:hypothetical protein